MVKSGIRMRKSEQGAPDLVGRRWCLRGTDPLDDPQAVRLLRQIRCGTPPIALVAGLNIEVQTPGDHLDRDPHRRARGHGYGCGEHLDEAIERFGQELAQRLSPFEQAVELLDSIPGVNKRIAEIVLAEVGHDLSRFPSAAHLASWAGVCPGNNESAGKRLSGRTRKGSRWLRQALIEAAHGAGRTKATYLGAQFRRLAAHRGKKKAVMAVAHSILVIMYYVLTRREPYRDLGVNDFDERDRAAVERRTIRRLERLGYRVEVVSQPVEVVRPLAG